MKKNSSNIMILMLLTLFLASTALAQYLIINSEQLQNLLAGKKKVTLIDVRMPEEYQAAHIPGAINIPSERMRADRNLLPTDKKTQIIFYCRGVG
ncbi:MAG: rhodanese-like domain-containing protein [Nitrospirota bacterium]